MATKRALALQERVEVIKLSNAGTSSRTIAEKFGVGKTQILNTIKRKAEFQKDFESGAPLKAK